MTLVGKICCRQTHGLISGLYGASTVFGVLIAALVSSIIMYYGKEYFRIAYCLSLVFAILTYYLRVSMKETPEYLSQTNSHNNSSLKNKLSKNSVFFAIAIISLLSGMLYGLPTRILNAILPLATDISQVTIMIINCSMLLVYILLLLFVGWISDKYNPFSIIKLSCFLIMILVIPAISLIENKTIISIILAKLIFTGLSAALIGPFHAWTTSISLVKNRYLQISTAYSLGKIGSIILLAYSISLFESYNTLFVPATILLLIAALFLLYLKYILKLNYFSQVK